MPHSDDETDSSLFDLFPGVFEPGSGYVPEWGHSETGASQLPNSPLSMASVPSSSKRSRTESSRLGNSPEYYEGLRAEYTEIKRKGTSSMEERDRVGHLKFMLDSKRYSDRRRERKEPFEAQHRAFGSQVAELTTLSQRLDKDNKRLQLENTLLKDNEGNLQNQIRQYQQLIQEASNSLASLHDVALNLQSMLDKLQSQGRLDRHPQEANLPFVPPVPVNTVGFFSYITPGPHGNAESSQDSAIAPQPSLPLSQDTRY